MTGLQKASDLTVTDMFCGAGGSSLGASRTGFRVRLAMNHWERAIETHNTNFPDTDHECTDISAANPRRYYPTDVLLASPECTNHSLAKGLRRATRQGEMFASAKHDPSAERSRATMWDVPRFAEQHRYRAIIVENVVDARSWVLYDAWLTAMHALGYAHREVMLNSMFAHPTPQSRDRLYVVFWRRGNRAPNLEIRPRAHCAACDAAVQAVQSWKAGRTSGRYKRQYVYCCPRCAREVTPYYYAALNAIDFTLPATKLRDRRRPLEARTIARIRFGLAKYGHRALVVRTNMTSGVACRVRDASVAPFDTQPGSAITALVTPGTLTTLLALGLPSGCLVTAGSRDNAPMPFDAPAGTATGSERFALVLNGAALRTSVTMPQAALIQGAPFVTSYYGTLQAAPLDAALATQPARETHALVAQAGADLDVDDCYFRMLATHEIGASMAFPANYVVTGTKREQVKQYGNAVTPPAMELLTRRVAASLAPDLPLDDLAA